MIHTLSLTGENVLRRAFACLSWRALPRLLTGAAFIALLCGNIFVQQYYVDRSRARPEATSGAFVEIPEASSSRLLQRLAEVRSELPPGTPVVSDAINEVLGKVEAQYTIGHDTVFRPDDHFGGVISLSPPSGLTAKLHLYLPEVQKSAFKLVRARTSLLINSIFSVPGVGPDNFATDSGFTSTIASPNAYVLRSGPRQGILNRWGVRIASPPVVAQPIATTQNLLIFVASSLGSSYYRRNKVATMFPVEPDTFAGGTMSGLNRFQLMQVVKPTPGRFEIRFSSTLRSDGQNRLPEKAVLYGARAQSLGFRGRGSARIFTPPVEPRSIDGGSYFLLDLGEPGRHIPVPRTGFMRLYGGEIDLDPRRLVGFSKDISLIPEGVYQRIVPPTSIGRFPSDLDNENLAYSGIYEDGWISEDVSLRLTNPASASPFVMRGLVPQIGDGAFRSTAVVSIDGRVAVQQELRSGPFEIVAKAGSLAAGPHDIRITFSRVLKLPNGDNRPTPALLNYAGFVGTERTNER